MISFNLSEYVEWLHVVENMDLWAAKEKAQKRIFKFTGKWIELHEIFSTSEKDEMRKLRAMTALKTKKPRKAA